MSCEHVVAHHSDYWLTELSVIDRCIDESYGWNKHQKTMAWIKGKKVKKLYKPSDFLDLRKRYLTMFFFCPYCGTEINWKKIKEALKTKTDGIKND